MRSVPTPIWSTLIYLCLTALAIWALWGRDFSPTSERLIGLGAMAILLGIGHVQFGGRFVRPRWKMVGKIVAALTLAWLMMVWVGPGGLLVPVAHQIVGWVGHMVICRRHGINWRTIEPRARYLALQEAWAQGEFGVETPDEGA